MKMLRVRRRLLAWRRRFREVWEMDWVLGRVITNGRKVAQQDCPVVFVKSSVRRCLSVAEEYALNVDALKTCR